MAIFEGNYMHSDLPSDCGSALLSRLNHFYAKSMFVDACLVFKGAEIFAHKIVLAAASSLFCQRLEEIAEGSPVKIDLEQDVKNVDINIEDVKILVDYIYTGQVDVSQARQTLIFELGNLLQIVGLQRPLGNAMQVPFYSTAISNQSVFSPFSINEGTYCEDITNIQTDIFPTSLLNYPAGLLLSPDKLDNAIKSDKTLQLSASNTSFSELSTQTMPLELSEFNDRFVECTADQVNSKYISPHDFPCNGLVDNSESVPFDSDYSSNDILIIRDQEKDLFDNRLCPLSAGSSDPDHLLSDLTTQPNTIFIPSLAPDLPPYDDEDPTPLELTFHGCKLSNSHTLPERQLRLKVKDSIGGVSLQDTSQGESNNAAPPKEIIIDSSVDCTYFLDRDSSLPCIRISEKPRKLQVVQEDFLQEQEHPKCFETVSIEDLSAHVPAIHDIRPSLKCRLCSYETISDSDLVQHGKKDHMNTTDHLCCFCGKKCKTKATLRNHLSSHSADNWFKCEQCNAHYSQRLNLLKHMASQHHMKEDRSPIEDPVSCSECSFTSFAPHKVQQHKIRCHSQHKAYKCNHCDYATTEKSSLAKHTRIHTQERPYICSACGIRFVTVSTLNRHMRTHTKEKPFKCSQCDKEYADRKRLREHSLKHQSIKPIQCSLCSYTCMRKDHLKSHMNRKHHSEAQEPTS